MKAFKIVRFCFYITLGILIFIFNEFLMDYINYVVSLVMILYGIEEISESLFHHKLKEIDNKLFSGLILFVMAALMIIVRNDDIIKTCIIWAIWSILREAGEIEESFHHLMNHKAGILDIAESAVVIVFSITLVLTSTVHHMHIHLILLGVELIAKVLFPKIDELSNKYIYSKIYKEDE